MARLLFPVALLAILCLTASAHAETAPPPPPAIDTVITGGPIEDSTTEDEAPSFSFAATRDGFAFPEAVFHCSLDGAPAVTCESPYQLEVEVAGPHTFSVYAEDPKTADRDPAPATRSFVLEPGETECEAEDEGEGELEVEAEEVEGCEAEEGSGDIPPPECLLRSARARVFTSPGNDKVRLVIRYTTFTPAEVDVDLRLGGSGSRVLGQARERFLDHGSFRLTETLGKREMARLRATSRLTVDLDLPAAPSFCRRYQTRHLTIRRTVHSHAVWSQSDSAFGLDP